MLSLLHPLMLYGALAVAVPIFLHFMLRRRTRVVQFSRLLFLADTKKFSERRFRLKQLLLMALRMAAILLIAAAFARPWWRNRAAVQSGPARSVALVLDVSASMSAETRFADAIKSLRSQVETLRAEDRAALVLAGRAAKVAVPMTNNKSAVLDSLAALASPTFEAGDLAAALESAAGLLAEEKSGVREIILASDLQRTNLRDMDADWRLPRGIELMVLKTGSDNPPNFAVEDAYDSGHAVRALIASYGAAAESTAEISLGGKTKSGSQSVTLANGAKTVVELGTPGQPSAAEVAVTAAGDAFAADDVRYFPPAPDSRKVLIVATGPDETKDDVIFPKLALEAGGYAEIRFVDPSQIAEATAGFKGLLIVPNCASIDPAAADRLAGLARNGATILMDARQDMSADDPRSTLADFKPTEWAAAGQGSTPVQMLADIDMRHPIFAPFRGTGKGNFASADFKGHLRISPGPTAAILATFDEGSPALIERPAGEGRLLFWTSTFGPDSGNFPLRGLYVAFMRSISETAGQNRQTGFAVGDAVPLSGEPGETVTVLAPGGNETSIKLDQHGKGFFSGASRPGLYAARGTQPHSFCVNIDAAESDLASAPQSELLARADAPREIASASLPVAGTDDAAARDALNWKFLLGSALIVALAELWLSNRIPM